MFSQIRPRNIITGTALLGVVGILSGVLVLGILLANPTSDSFATGLGIAFALGYVTTGILALVEAGLLYIVTQKRTPSVWSRRLFTLGASAGGVAVILLVALLLPVLLGAFAGEPITVGGDFAFGIGVWLVPIGITCSVLGVLVQVIGGSRSAITGNRS